MLRMTRAESSVFRCLQFGCRYSDAGTVGRRSVADQTLVSKAFEGIWPARVCKNRPFDRLRMGGVTMPLLEGVSDKWIRQTLSESLRRIGCSVPAWLPRGTAVGNRVLKPVYRQLLGPQWETVEAWPGVRMTMNPCECMGGNLFFSPQLYDRTERQWLQEVLTPDSVFVDVGANLGAYTLWAARHLSSAGMVVAIEADPETFQVLRGNIAKNTLSCRVVLENVGVSDSVDQLSFYRSSANSGGNSFFVKRPETLPAITLRTEPLYDTLRRHDVSTIRLLKIDVEGLELKVLGRFFEDCSSHVQLRPEYLLVEVDEGPRGKDKAYVASLTGMLESNGYAMTRSGKNALFSRR